MALASVTQLPRVFAFGFLLFLLAPVFVAAQDGRIPSTASLTRQETTLVGLWGGIDSEGIVVSYLFERDGTAVIYENEKPVLEGTDGASLTWSLDMQGPKGGLDLVYDNGLGVVATVSYAVRFDGKGRLVLKSGGAFGSRPGDVDDKDSRLQIKLSRRY